MAKQVDIDKENRKLEEMANDETYSDKQREEVRARLPLLFIIFSKVFRNVH